MALKVLPARTALQSQSDADYFGGDNKLFMSLFRYIDSNDLAMTVPVEADVDASRMRFFVGQKIDKEALKSTDKVKVIAIPEAMVISAGLRGGYSQKTWDRGVVNLDAWLKANPDYEPVGEAFGVYWNGPFVPGFLKRSEVNRAVRKRIEADAKK